MCRDLDLFARAIPVGHLGSVECSFSVGAVEPNPTRYFQLGRSRDSASPQELHGQRRGLVAALRCDGTQIASEMNMRVAWTAFLGRASTSCPRLPSEPSLQPHLLRVPGDLCVDGRYRTIGIPRPTSKLEVQPHLEFPIGTKTPAIEPLGRADDLVTAGSVRPQGPERHSFRSVSAKSHCPSCPSRTRREPTS